MCNSEKPRFIEKQDARELLSSLVSKAALSKFPS